MHVGYKWDHVMNTKVRCRYPVHMSGSRPDVDTSSANTQIKHLCGLFACARTRTYFELAARSDAAALPHLPERACDDAGRPRRSVRAVPCRAVPCRAVPCRADRGAVRVASRRVASRRVSSRRVALRCVACVRTGARVGDGHVLRHVLRHVQAISCAQLEFHLALHGGVVELMDGPGRCLR